MPGYNNARQGPPEAPVLRTETQRRRDLESNARLRTQELDSACKTLRDTVEHTISETEDSYASMAQLTELIKGTGPEGQLPIGPPPPKTSQMLAIVRNIMQSLKDTNFRAAGALKRANQGRDNVTAMAMSPIYLDVECMPAKRPRRD